MLTKHAYIKLSFVVALAAFFTTSAPAQTVATVTSEAKTGIAFARGPRGARPIVANTPVPAPAKTPTPDDVEDQIAAMKAENAAVREQLKKMEENQKALLETLDRMQRRLDGVVAEKAEPDPAATDARPGSADPSSTTVASAAPAKQKAPERYQEGIVIWKTPDEDRVPFMLRLNGVTQFRYLNTLNSDDTYTDHLGVVREVHNRNDLTVNRTMFLLNGYFYSKKLQYSFMVWTAAGAASIIVAGSIGYQFNRHLTLTGGYLGIPGSRSLTNTFPYFTSTDRSMADNFFRPGFTQGVMASGEIKKGLYYMAFLGNSLNTLSITANKIDTNLLGAGTIWWEPLGNYAPPGRTVNMYDDYFAEKKWRIRLGTSFTASREDRFSNLDTSSPENTGVYNSDGPNAFQTGAFALGVTVKNATYRMWAMDWGAKYNGLAINGQYYFRTLTNFDADGPLPLDHTFDHGYEMSVSKFVIPRKVMVYGRGSGIFGQFKNPYEYGAGVKWHFLPTERLWIMAELMNVKGAAYSGAFSPYTSGMNGWIPMVSSVLSF